MNKKWPEYISLNYEKKRIKMALWQGFSNIDFAVYPAIASNRLLYAGH